MGKYGWVSMLLQKCKRQLLLTSYCQKDINPFIYYLPGLLLLQCSPKHVYSKVRFSNFNSTYYCVSAQVTHVPALILLSILLERDWHSCVTCEFLMVNLFKISKAYFYCKKREELIQCHAKSALLPNLPGGG